MTARSLQRGSALVWIIAILVVLGIAAVGFMWWGKIFLLTTGTDSSQVGSYTKAIDSANQLQQKVENTNQNGTNSVDQLNSVKGKLPQGY